MSVLVVDKPSGPSSFAVLRRVRGLIQAAYGRGRLDLPDPRRAGHGGTLDPMASGVLPVLLGEATKIAPYVLGADKVYEATLQLGVLTDSQDATGKVIATRPVGDMGPGQWEAVLADFRGAIKQVPPMHSALKQQGQRLYKLARAGKEVDRPARDVTIHELRLLDRPAHDTARLLVHASKGTYVRTLAVDIGLALGCGAHLAALRRIRASGFIIEGALTPNEIETRLQADEPLPFVSLREALAGMPMVTVDAEVARRIGQGQKLPWETVAGGLPDNHAPEQPVVVLSPGDQIVAIVGNRDGVVRVLRGFSDAVPSESRALQK